MNPSTPPTPPEPGSNYGSETDSLRSIIMEFDGPGDFTVRPMRSPDNLRIRHDQPPQPPTNPPPNGGTPNG